MDDKQWQNATLEEKLDWLRQQVTYAINHVNQLSEQRQMLGRGISDLATKIEDFARRLGQAAAPPLTRRLEPFLASVSRRALGSAVSRRALVAGIGLTLSCFR